MKIPPQQNKVHHEYLKLRSTGKVTAGSSGEWEVKHHADLEFQNAEPTNNKRQIAANLHNSAPAIRHHISKTSQTSGTQSL